MSRPLPGFRVGVLAHSPVSAGRSRGLSRRCVGVSDPAFSRAFIQGAWR